MRKSAAHDNANVNLETFAIEPGASAVEPPQRLPNRPRRLALESQQQAGR